MHGPHSSFQGSKGGRPGYGIVRRSRACFYDAAFRLHNRDVPLYGPVFRCGGRQPWGRGFGKGPPSCPSHPRSRRVRHFVAAVPASTDGVFELALEVVAEAPGELGDGLIELAGA